MTAKEEAALREAIKNTQTIREASLQEKISAPLTSVQEAAIREGLYDPTRKAPAAPNIVEPSHYHQGHVDPLDLIAAAGDDKGFVRGSLIKYVHRFEDKDDPEGDLVKAAYYLGWLIGIQSGQDVEGRRQMATLMADVAKGGM